MLTHTYAPRGAARDLFKCREPEVLLAGAAGTGKSRACLEKLHLACLRTPNVRAAIIRKTQVSLASTALKTYREQVALEALAAGLVFFHGGGPQDPPQYRYSNGSTVTIAGLDRPTRIMSSEYDMIFVQEATELEITDWEMLSTRLRNGRLSFQQLIADCNPDTPQHWLKARADRGGLTLLTSLHSDNPVLYREDGELTPRGDAYMAKLRALTGVRKERLLYGRWAAAEGMIYEEWQEPTHLLNRFTIPNSWPRYWAVDFGFTNPFVCQHWAEDPDGRLYLYREFYHTRMTVDQHARRILAEVADPRDGRWREPKPRAVVCDHDAENAAVLGRELGLPTLPANKKVAEGIQAVQRRLRVQPDGKPRLFILRDSLVERDAALEEDKRPTCTAEEIPGYIWDPKVGPANREVPLKRDDHGSDAMRYMVADFDLTLKPNIRTM